MARGVKQQKTGLNTDFTITDVAKRARARRSMLESAGNVSHNATDDLSNELEHAGESEAVRKIFED
jgi:hypothetical protein